MGNYIPVNQFHKDFTGLVNTCLNYDNLLYEKYYLPQIKIIESIKDKSNPPDYEMQMYNAIFLFFRDAIEKLHKLLTSKKLMTHNLHFWDPDYFRQPYQLANDLKILFVEIFLISEWELRKQYGNKINLHDIAYKMGLDVQLTKDLIFLKNIRNAIIHNAGFYQEESQDWVFQGNIINVRKGKIIAKEDNFNSLTVYFSFIYRLIEIMYNWLNKDNYFQPIIKMW
ncbi:MAG: hypothetical protein HeimC2_42460 [Candidatus Heimdallarchaeota archaeon LC_2]|nr:MAG: hypothetical protein HeimC2_42460 [Candidatus Heimdallarchaeota archaeon LC_2]